MRGGKTARVPLAFVRDPPRRRRPHGPVAWRQARRRHRPVQDPVQLVIFGRWRSHVIAVHRLVGATGSRPFLHRTMSTGRAPLAPTIAKTSPPYLFSSRNSGRVFSPIRQSIRGAICSACAGTISASRPAISSTSLRRMASASCSGACTEIEERAGAADHAVLVVDIEQPGRQAEHRAGMQRHGQAVDGDAARQHRVAHRHHRRPHIVRPVAGDVDHLARRRRSRCPRTACWRRRGRRRSRCRGCAGSPPGPARPTPPRPPPCRPPAARASPASAISVPPIRHRSRRSCRSCPR